MKNKEDHQILGIYKMSSNKFQPYPKNRERMKSIEILKTSPKE